MPFPREYTPRRRWIMTLVMWMIFAGTLGIAALISRAPASAIVLDQRTTIGEISLSLPAGWKIESDNFLFVRSGVTAEEPVERSAMTKNDVEQRSIRVAVELDNRFPQDLVRERLIRFGVTSETVRYVDEAMPVGPLSGVMWAGDREEKDAGGIAVVAALLPKDGTITVELQARRLDRSDVALLRKIAESVQIFGKK